jgi:hypothetical protein
MVLDVEGVQEKFALICEIKRITVPAVPLSTNREEIPKII